MSGDKELFGSLLTLVETTRSEDVGTVRSDEFGNKYIYLQGIASVALGSVVTYKITSLTACTMVLATTGSKGHIAVAMAAVVASSYGWFQIEGWTEEVLAISGGDAAVGGRVFLTGTAGQIDDVVTEGDEIIGMQFTVQEGETTLGAGYAGVYMNAPRTLENVATPDLTQVDAAALYAVGARFTDEDGNVFVYLQGLASTAEGDWVTYRITSTAAAVTKRAVAGDQGNLAIAMAAILATKFGWYQIFGNNLRSGAITGGNAAAAAAVFLTSTAGKMDDVEVADDRVSGAVFSVQEGELSGNPAALAGANISYPFCGMGWPVRPVLSQIDDSALYNVGRTFKDETTGNEWIYLSGVSSCVEGSWLTYYITSTAASVTALFAANAIGLIAIAVGALENTKFGWAQIAGNNLRAKAASGGDAAAGAIVYYQAAGIVDDQVSAGNMVYGAVFSIQEGELSGNPAGLAGVTIHYPFVTDEST